METDLIICERSSAAENDFIVYYPNGSASSPPYLSADSTFQVQNPFPNYYIDVILEIKYDGIWFQPGWTATSNKEGSTAIQWNDDKIQLHTGSDLSCYCGGISIWPNVHGPLPYRLKVKKLGKIK